MATYTQAERTMRVSTVLGEDGLLLAGFSGEDGISTPFMYTLDLASEDGSIDPDQMLRSAAVVTLQLATEDEGSDRKIHGLINRFVQLDRQGDLVSYRAQIVPWLWFLSLATDCRIFQELSVLEIVQQVFDDLGQADFEIRCGLSYPKREFCVQYRETHLNFVSRLLEEEGIVYFFEHSEDKHVLVLADSATAADPCPGQSVVAIAQPGPWQDADVVTSFQREHAVQTGVVTLRDYDALQPSLQLENSVSGTGAGELYDYPGNFTKLEEGDRYVRLLLEEREAWQHVVRGQSTCRALRSGYTFDLKDHYRADANKTYRLLHVHHMARTGSFRAGDEAGIDYENSFVAIPDGVPFHPPRVGPKPLVQGSQTAVVVGPAGEEIYVDEHGRVKVQFHWDRLGKKNEKSSCWVRVSTNWAGKGWGWIQLPRIGQEVIVDFLEGDPDRPIITGRVYNATQVPPYELPANKTQSGIKSRSSKGGTAENFNEIRLEDKKGSEQIYIHAEKDMQLVVENDRSEEVGNNESISVGNDQTVSVGNDQSEIVRNNKQVQVEKDQNITIGGNHSESIGKDMKHSVQGNEDVSIGKDLTEDVKGASSLQVGKDSAVSIGKNHGLDVGKNITVKAGDSITIESAKEVVIKAGQASIQMKKNGDIVIKGGKIQMKGSKDLVLKGSKIAAN